MSSIQLTIGAAPGPVPENTSTLTIQGKEANMILPSAGQPKNDGVQFDNRKNKNRFHVIYIGK